MRWVNGNHVKLARRVERANSSNADSPARSPSLWEGRADRVEYFLHVWQEMKMRTQAVSVAKARLSDAETDAPARGSCVTSIFIDGNVKCCYRRL